MHGVGCAKFARLHDKGDQPRRNTQEEKRITKPLAQA